MKLKLDVVLATLIFACLAHPAQAQATSFDGSNDSGSPECDNQYVRNFPQSDGASCSYVTYTFNPVADGQLSVTVTPTNGYAWGTEGYPSGTPGMFAQLGPYSNPDNWAFTGVSRYSSQGNSSAPIVRSIPVKAGHTYYLLVGRGGWGFNHNFPSGTFHVDAALPVPVVVDAPLPFWALGSLGLGLMGIATRRIKKLKGADVAAMDG